MMKNDIEIIPYGDVFHTLKKSRWRAIGQHARIRESFEDTREVFQRLVVMFSQDLDSSFVKSFREQSNPDTRLLILNRGLSADSVLTRILDLQIRTPQRCYVLEGRSGVGKSNMAAFLLYSLLERWVSAIETGEAKERILDARVEDGTLHVVSPNFDRLEVPVAKIPDLRNAEHSRLEEFEIDEDGAFIYWPDLDVHLGWPQLQQIVDPNAALKASQKSTAFNQRYGKAVQKIREAAGLALGDVLGISDKQLRRIERGECRLTSNAIEALAKSHNMRPNEYMQKLAEALE
jgi:Protein of unknown function (DUF2442)